MTLLPDDATGPSHTPDTVAASPQPRYNTSSPDYQPPTTQQLRRGMFSTFTSAVKAGRGLSSSTYQLNLSRFYR
jgi:hypothetical protein